jgi:hypothetical protein
LTAFWNALRNDKTEIKEGVFLTLPDEVFILGDSSLGSSLYVRPCYPKLLKLCLEIIETKATPHLVILGNPGIGKTYFGFFMLLHFAKSGKPVVYESGKSKVRYLFSEGLITKGSQSDFVAYLDDDNTMFIVDACTPVDVPAKTILLSSPRRDIWYKYSDSRCTIRFMPTWSNNEMQSCREKLFPHLSVQQVNDLYDKWGGVPRFVLESALDEEKQKYLDRAIEAVDLDVIVQAIGNLDIRKGASHRLVHLLVKEGFHSDVYVFASKYVVDRIYPKLLQDKRQQLIGFLAVSDGIGELGPLRGILFERYAHSIIQNGGKFRVRELQESMRCEETTVDIPRSRLVVFDRELSFNEIGDGYVYEKPKSKNYESVDSFIRKLSAMFQMTGARNHPCKQSGINKVVHLMGNPKVPLLYFVVPNDRFDNFVYQKYVGSDGKILQDGPYFNTVKRVKQFVLSIDLIANIMTRPPVAVEHI